MSTDSLADLLRDRTAVLANGDRVPLLEAALSQMRLAAQLPLEESEWDVVYHLREVCLGRPIDREPERTLIREGWLGEDGGVDPVLRSVVLAGIRGEGRQLRLDSPYTDPVDRALADFFLSREFLASQLDHADLPALFDKPPLDRAFDHLRNLAQEGNGPSDEEARSFVDRLRERLREGDPPGSLPPK
ncbi:MAG: hypothetical protein K2V38_02650 [Gemmataceae bacterium]|nr:hypothetical protein [Gemmataceae bacterium]